jgi:hypothetical protein
VSAAVEPAALAAVALIDAGHEHRRLRAKPVSPLFPRFLSQGVQRFPRGLSSTRQPRIQN